MPESLMITTSRSSDRVVDEMLKKDETVVSIDSLRRFDIELRNYFVVVGMKNSQMIQYRVQIVIFWIKSTILHLVIVLILFPVLCDSS